MATEKQTAQPSVPEIQVDYVLVFSTDGPKSEQGAIAQEYARLLKALDKVGLQAVGRPGAKGKKQILVCVRAPELVVQAEVTRESLSDWLHGVSSTRPDPRAPRDFQRQPISSSERLRLVHNLIVCSDAPSPVAQSPTGAAITPGSKEFPHLLSFFPPHDPAFNHKWLHEWSRPSTAPVHQSKDGEAVPAPASGLLSTASPALIQLRDHFGPCIALYFTFLRTYFLALLAPASLGLLHRLLSLLPPTSFLHPAPFPPLYAIFLVLWSTTFVEAWRIREKKLGVEWGTHRVQEVQRIRAGFVPTQQITDVVTGDKEGTFPWWMTASRMGAATGAVVGAAAGLAVLISTIYSIEVFINEVYDGPGKKYLSLLPTVLFAGIVPQVIGIWQRTATELTKWENHKHESSHETSLTLKMFALNTLVSYGGLILTSYIYVPFGGIIVPQVMGYMRSSGWVDAVKFSDKKVAEAFSINSERLENTLFALTTTTQAIGAFTEIGLPFVMRLVASYREKAQASKNKSKPGSEIDAQDETDEAEFLQRIRKEAELPEYNLFAEYAEMAIQFGYVCLWSVIWPLVPLMAVINNFFEIRGDAYKLTAYTRRPIPTRTNTIGPWLEALSTLAWLSALTNSSLIYLFRPITLSADAPDSPVSLSIHPSAIFHSTFVANASSPLSPTAQAFYHSRIRHASAFPPELHTAFSSIRRTLLAAFLVALASEHGLRLARTLIRKALEQVFWKGSAEETELRRAEWALKKGYLEGLGMGVDDMRVNDAKDVVGKLKREVDQVKSEVGFWGRGDKGQAELSRSAKME